LSVVTVSPKANSSTSRSRQSNVPAKASSLEPVEARWPLSDNAARVLHVLTQRQTVRRMCFFVALQQRAEVLWDLRAYQVRPGRQLSGAQGRQGFRAGRKRSRLALEEAKLFADRRANVAHA